MTAIKLKSIVGIIPKRGEPHYEGIAACWDDIIIGRNQIIDEVGELEIELDRNKLAEVLNNFCDKNRDSNDGI